MLLRGGWAFFSMYLGCGGGGGEGEGEGEAEGQAICPADIAGTLGALVTLNVAIDVPSLSDVPPATSTILIRAEIEQQDDQVIGVAEICELQIPPVMLMGLDKPVVFEPHEDFVPSLEPVAWQGTFDSETCNYAGEPFATLAGARLDSPTDPLPQECCLKSPPPLCSESGCKELACDQEGDGLCGASVWVRNAPPVAAVDQIQGVVRALFTFVGEVQEDGSIQGTIASGEGDKLLEQAILGCSVKGKPCTSSMLAAVRTLNPSITQNPETDSLFTAKPIDEDVDCETLLAMRDQIFR